MGTPQFSVPSLTKLIKSNHEVISVVCQPDKPKGRSKTPVAPPTKIVAEKHSIPVLQPAKIKTNEFFEEVKSIKPDLIAVVAYGKILPKSILEFPKFGCINVHASILPKYRGAAPINWAIVRGETKTGVTTMLMDEGMDTGDILKIEEIEITNGETSIELADQLSDLGAELLLKTINLLEEKKVTPIKQNNNDATYAPLMKKEDGKINWNKEADEIRNLIRGMQPWPNAYTTLDGKNLKIFKAEVKNGEGKPGEIVFACKDSLKVATGKNILDIRELQLEGSKRMNTENFLRGKTLEQGTQLDT